MAPLALDDSLVQTFMGHAALLALKLLFLSMLTAGNRLWRGIFSNPEDAKLFRGKVQYDNAAVERVRRAHLNDLENIPAFWVLGALYLTTGPSVVWATLLFRVFTVCRLIHTVVYAIIPLPQPTRAIAFGIPYAINIYLGAQTVLYYVTSL